MTNSARLATAIRLTILGGIVAAGAAYAVHGATNAASHSAAPPQQTPPPQRTPGAPPAPPADKQRPTSVTVQPEELAKELSGNNKPIVVCVAPRALYDGAHVPGAVFHGAASTPEGLADFKQWAQGVPKDSKIVLYCGCCPFSECPNVRPALMALRQMGFTHVQVLMLPKDFHTDWMEKGLPVEKGR